MPRRRRAPTYSWWPLYLSVALGVLLVAHLWTPLLKLPSWGYSLLLISFWTSVGAFVVGDLLRFLGWWFWRRHSHRPARRPPP
ncbi:MAG: hypothetical protein GEU79_13605 [Acidimicrobiia bacterium]|nr:hypothetical protein [Acidimicrobiia bacterium]